MPKITKIKIPYAEYLPGTIIIAEYIAICVAVGWSFGWYYGLIFAVAVWYIFERWIKV